MKRILMFIFFLPFISKSQTIVYDSIVVPNPAGGFIRYTYPHIYTAFTNGDSIVTYNPSTKRTSRVAPMDLPIATITQTALNLKAPLASPTFTGTVTQTSATISTSQFALSPLTTTNSTPVLIASVAIPTNKSYDIDVYMMAVKSDGATRNCGYIRGVFSRVAGNLSQDGSLKNDLLGVLSTTKVTFVLNNTTHEVEIYANGLAATTINWKFRLEITNDL